MPLDLNLSQVLDIFQLLTQVYPRYVDAGSREAAEAVGVELVRRDELRETPQGEPDERRLGVTENIVLWLAHEVDRMAKRPGCVLYHSPIASSRLMTRLLPRAHASTDVFVLLSWCCGIYTVCLQCNPEFPSERSWSPLVSTIAALLNLLLDKATKTKPTVQKSALVRTRRALRTVSREYYHLDDCMTSDTLLEPREDHRSPQDFDCKGKISLCTSFPRTSARCRRRRQASAKEHQRRFSQADR